MLLTNKQEIIDQETWSNNVQKLKGYEELKQLTNQWLLNYKDDLGQPSYQGTYSLVFDDKLGWCVDVDGDVDFYNPDFFVIPFKFRNVTGNFSILNSTKLYNLTNCPVYINDNFYCCYCEKLTSLKGGPKQVEGDYNCTDCTNLSDWTGYPAYVGGFFNYKGTNLK